MKFCKRCLYSTSHPLGLTLNEDGICSGCLIHVEKDELDWSQRWTKLEQIVNPYRNKAGKNYDCIIPVSGAQDSYYIVYLVKGRLGLNPLLVTYNKYFNTPLGIRNLANLRVQFNCDIIYQNINPISVKKVTRSTLRKFGSVYWPILAGQTVFPVQIAVKYDIPLIIWGAHQGVEQVGMFSHEHEVEMSRRYRKDHDLMGYEADDLLSIFDTLKEEDIWQYRYPDDSELNAVGVRGIYLGNYVRWDPLYQHDKMVREYSYQSAKFNRTFDYYDYVDCFNYMDVHDLLKLYKHGYSKVTDHACREIRFGRLSRDKALGLVRHFEQAPLKYLRQFCDWLGTNEPAMHFLLNQYRNPIFWEQLEPGRWDFKGLSSYDTSTPLSIQSENDSEINELLNLNSKLEHSLGDSYITVGKGWP